MSEGADVAGEVTTVTREDVERAIWTLTGWRGGQEMVDQLLDVCDAYARTLAQAVAGGSEAGTQALGGTWVWEPTKPDESQAEAGTERCTKCHQVKPLDLFGRDNARKNGLKAQCKACVNEVRRDWHRRKTGGGGGAG